MAISSEWAGPPVEWAGLPVSPTLPYLRISKLCFMHPGTAHYNHVIATLALGRQVVRMCVHCSLISYQEHITITIRGNFDLHSMISYSMQIALNKICSVFKNYLIKHRTVSFHCEAVRTLSKITFPDVSSFARCTHSIYVDTESQCWSQTYRLSLGKHSVFPA